jgi:acetate kinase
VRVLVANAGSSTLKLDVLGADDALLASAELPPEAERGAIEEFLATAPAFDAVGHRVVHGGRELRRSAIVNDGILERLRAVGDLAPLHNAPALATLQQLRSLRPALPHVACFDTAFHASLPDEAALYALPRDWIERFGIRRFGFHGLSHAYVARRAAELVGVPLEQLRLVTCHLGAGASLAAIRGGVSVDTTMGFTPLDGLVMATRSGSVDPGALLWLQRHANLRLDDLEHSLEHDSGLRGLAGTADMRDVLAAADRGEQRAGLALGVYLHRLRAQIAAMAAAMDGLDALVFTGGVGERSARVRAEACRGLLFLGVEIDSDRNEAPELEDGDLTGSGATKRVLAVRSREDLAIAGEVRSVLEAPRPGERWQRSS